MPNQFQHAADLISEADALVIAAVTVRRGLALPRGYLPKTFEPLRKLANLVNKSAFPYGL